MKGATVKQVGEGSHHLRLGMMFERQLFSSCVRRPEQPGGFSRVLQVQKTPASSLGAYG